MSPDENAQRPQSGHFGVVPRLSGAFIGLGPLGKVKLHNGVAQQTIRPRPVGQHRPIVPAPRDAPGGRIIPLPLPPPLFRIPPQPAPAENKGNEKNNGKKKRSHCFGCSSCLGGGDSGEEGGEDRTESVGDALQQGGEGFHCAGDYTPFSPAFCAESEN